MSTLTLPEVVSGRFVTDMDEDEYFSHPALSASGMKQLLRSPKHFRADRSMAKSKPAFTVGHAAHAEVLGVGKPYVMIPASVLSDGEAVRSNAAKAWVADAEAKGQSPLKPTVYAAVRRATQSVLANEKARRLLEAPGFTEVSLFADDPDTGHHLRGRLDRLADQVVDFKSTTDVRRQKLAAVINDFHYDLSGAVYRFLVDAVLGYDPGPMQLIFWEKEPPHEVRVVPLSGDWVEGGRRKMRAAIDLYARCVEFGSWPGDDDDDGPVRELDPPAYYQAALGRLEGAF